MAFTHVQIFVDDEGGDRPVSFEPGASGTMRVKCVGAGRQGGGGYAQSDFIYNPNLTYLVNFGGEGSYFLEQFGIFACGAVFAHGTSGGGRDDPPNYGDITSFGGNAGNNDVANGGGGGAGGPTADGTNGEDATGASPGAGGLGEGKADVNKTDLTEGIGPIRVYAGDGGNGGSPAQVDSGSNHYYGGGALGAPKRMGVIVLLYTVTAGAPPPLQSRMLALDLLIDRRK